MEEITELQGLRRLRREVTEESNDPEKRKLLLRYLGFKFNNEGKIIELNGNKIDGTINQYGDMTINDKISIKVHAGEPLNLDNKEQQYYIILCDESNISQNSPPCIYFGTEKEKLEGFRNHDSYTDNRIEDLKDKLKEIIMEKNVFDIIKENIQRYKQVIFTGAPGTGKTHGVRTVVEELCGGDKKRMKFVQFHPSYDYTDFVEGLRPVKLGEDKEPTFVRLDGTFKKFCREAVKHKDKNYYFIADEINRADLSKVFGELMFGLEESKRGKKFDTQYMNLPTYEVKDEDKDGENGNENNAVNGNENNAVTGKKNNEVKKKVITEIAEDVFKDGFYIPENLYFIGTMNDIDRSVESFDFALRRRFRWVEIEANAIMESSLESMLKDKATPEDITTLTENVKKLNSVIENSGFGLTKAYHIGPAYLEEFDGTNAEDIFKYRIEPLLREYTRGRDSNKVNDFIVGCREAFLKGLEDK